MKFDWDKNITLKDQFRIMLVILSISCLLFTIVYLIHSCNISNASQTGVQSQLEGFEVSNISSAESSDFEVSEQSQDSKAIENSEVSQASEKPESYEESNNRTVLLSGNIGYVPKNYNEVYDGALTLVNKDYECHHDGDNTVKLYENKSDTYAVATADIYINSDVVEPLNNMIDDFTDIYGYSDLMIACAYRSYAVQVGLYNDEIKNNGADVADKWVAPPGFSEHQTGYVFDFNLNIDNGISGIKYNGEGIYEWINTNCYQYGFILRYPQGKEQITGYEYEPWHFRYVGIPHATYIMNKNITLEEYIDIVHTCSIEDPLIIDGYNGEQWAVYYIKSEDRDITNIAVSQNYPYEISGDNFSGFIVTQKLK